MRFRLALKSPIRWLALALTGAALAVAFAPPPDAPTPAPATGPDSASAAPAARGDAPRSYAYYPEQLAALSSLNGFAPVADPGRPASAATPAAEPPKEPAAARKAAHAADTRRAESNRSTAPLAPAQKAGSVAVSAAETAREPEEWRVFGVALPRPGWPDGDALRRHAANWRDAAASLPGKAMALGGRLWPAADQAADAKSDADSPSRAN